MKKLILAILALATLSAFGIGEPIQRNQFTTNLQAAASAYVPGTNIFYASKIGAYRNATPTSPAGASNDRPAIQAVLDMATNGRPIHFIQDGWSMLSSNLIVQSNTKIEVLPGAGFILTNNSYCSILTTPLTGAGTNINATNIVIQGGVWNCNRAGQFPIAGPYVMEGNPVSETGLYACGFWLAGVSNIVIRDLEIQNASVYAVALNDLNDVKILNVKANWTTATSGGNDGIHCWGSTTNIYVDGFTSNGGDDIIAMNTSQFKAYSQSTSGINQRWQTNYGIHTNMMFMNIGRLGGGGQWIRWEGHASLRDAIWGLTVRNVYGILKNGCANSTLEMRRVTFDGLNFFIDPAFNGGGSPILTFLGVTNDILTIRNVNIVDPSGALENAGVYILGVDSLCNQVNISGVNVSMPQATIADLIQVNDSGTSNAMLSVENVIANGVPNIFSVGATWRGKVRLSNVNLGGTGIIGGTLFTNFTGDAASRIIQTNFVSGAPYVNTYGGPIHVATSAVLSEAAVTGASAMELRITGAMTNFSSLVTSAISVPGAVTNTLAGFVPAGSSFTFTNTSTGAGNSSSLRGGQIFIH